MKDDLADDKLVEAMEALKRDRHTKHNESLSPLMKEVAWLESAFSQLHLPMELFPVAECGAGLPPRIGRYRIVRRLGHGAYGIVYLAFDDALQRKVAIKTLRSDWEIAGVSLLDEARKACCLKHTGIVSILDVGQSADGAQYIVMEYIDGQSLRDRLIAARPSFHRSALWCAELADALAYAHELGFVHCDVKPANVLLDASDRTHLVDFGLAVHESEQQRLIGDKLGTPLYASPELRLGKAHLLDGRTDIWSLGVVLYELLTGRPPFRGETEEMLDEEIQSRAPRPPRQINPAIPEQLEHICLKCLEKRPVDRYSTARDVAAELRLSHPLALRSSRRNWIAACGAGAGALGVMVAIASLWKTSASLSGEIVLSIWSPRDQSIQGLPITERGVAPVRSGDQFRVRVTLNRPAYVYVVFVGSEGTVQLAYPKNKEAPPESEAPCQVLELPQEKGLYWTMKESPPGTETVLLLLRETQMPGEVNVEQLLSDLPNHVPSNGDNRIRVFEEGRLIADFPSDRPTGGAPATRSVDTTPQPSAIDAPITTLQREIALRLGPHFERVQALTYARID